MNNPMKPEVTTPPVAETVAAAPPPIPPKRHVTKALTLAGICAATPACIPIFTETKAGDCYYVVQHELEGKTVPDVMYASLDESNPRGPCAGEWDIGYISRDEPCPVYDNDEIILRMAGDSPEEFPWYGPERNPMKKGQCWGRDWFWGRDGEKPSLLIGRTRVFDATGKYKSGFGHPPRDYVRRMTALITEIRTPDGQSVKVCGVLFGSDDKEGVPVFLSPEDGKPFGGSWGASYVKFFWPEETKQKSKKK